MSGSHANVRASGDPFLADIEVPATADERVGVEFESPFGDGDSVELRR